MILVGQPVYASTGLRINTQQERRDFFHDENKQLVGWSYDHPANPNGVFCIGSVVDGVRTFDGDTMKHDPPDGRRVMHATDQPREFCQHRTRKGGRCTHRSVAGASDYCPDHVLVALNRAIRWWKHGSHRTFVEPDEYDFSKGVRGKYVG